MYGNRCRQEPQPRPLRLVLLLAFSGVLFGSRFSKILDIVHAEDEGRLRKQRVGLQIEREDRPLRCEMPAYDEEEWQK